MTKRKTSPPKKSRSDRSNARAAAPATAGGEHNWLTSAAMRETIESVIIAFILAFLFRTFEAEAFVIPTGSMAPTLMGKHKDVECPMCHYCYQANASDDQQKNRPVDIATTTCPMCGYTADVASGNPQGKSYVSYDGDRILVAKFPYEFADPKPWDVVVFKYPGDSTMNYIKRLVGLPGETIRIQDGDLWIRGRGNPDRFQIARKPPLKILAMLQPVYDNDLAPTISGELGWPQRWTSEPSASDYAWTELKDRGTEAKDLSSFCTSGTGPGEAWLRYRHRVPTSTQWSSAAQALRKTPSAFYDAKGLKSLMKDHVPPPDSVLPQLISDFTAYDTSRPVVEQPLNRDDQQVRTCGLHWVGDLAVQFELESTAAAGKVMADLVKGGRHFQCRFDLATGAAALAITGDEPEAKAFHPAAATTVKGVGRHTIIFSNVDDQLRLWVDGSLVKFEDDRGTEKDTATAYDSLDLPDHIPTLGDLAPVGIGAESAQATVRHIKVMRDVYYIADARHCLPGQEQRRYPEMFSLPNQNPPLMDFTVRVPKLVEHANCEKDWEVDFSQGNMWTVEVSLSKAADPQDRAKDQFFVLGDNSAFSQDGRLWQGDLNWRGGQPQYWVDRELLIGKALFIYWPHGWGIPHVSLPINPIPNFSRMHLVR